MDPTTPTEFLNKASKALELNHLANQPIRQNWQVTMPYDDQNPLEFFGQQTHCYWTPRYSAAALMQWFAESFGNAREAIQQQQTENVYSFQSHFDDDYGANEMRSTFLRNNLRESDDLGNDDYENQSYQNQPPSFTYQ